MKVKKWIGNIISVVLVIMLLFVTYFVVSSKITGGKPKVFGYELMTVLSGSMEPTIKTGSIIAVKPISNADKRQVGEVVTYRTLDDPNTLITHRIMKIQKSGKNVEYTTKGDNNKSEDPKPVSPAQIVGTYANFTVPGLGYTSNFIKSKTGIICVLIVPGALLIVYQLITMCRIIMKLEEKQKVSAESNTKESSKTV